MTTLFIIGALFLIALSLVLYFPARKGPFVLDDILLAKHPAAQKNFEWRHVFGMFSRAGISRGLAWASFAFNVHWWGAVELEVDPPQDQKAQDRALFGYHVLNFILHGIAGTLLWLSFVPLLHPWAAFLAALLFIAHSLSSSAVAHISGRYNVLAGVFGFLSVGLMLNGHPLLATLAVLIACLANESSVTFAGTLLLIGLIHGIEWAWIPLITVSVLIFWKRRHIQDVLSKTGEQGIQQCGYAPSLTTPDYQITSFTEWFLRLPCWMVGLRQCVDPKIRFHSWTSPGFWAAVVILSGSFALASNNPLLMTALVWIVISPILVSVFIPVPDPVFEYRAYFSVGGMALLLGYLLSFFPMIVGLGVVLWFSIATWNRAKFYSSDKSFWESSIASGGREDRAFNNMGYAAQMAANRATNPIEYTACRNAARAYYAQALNLYPNLAHPRSNIALMDDFDKKLDDAIGGMTETVLRNPEFYQGWHYLGTFLEKVSRFDEAEDAYRKAVEIEPNWAMAWNRLGLITGVTRKDMALAAVYFRRALSVEPSKLDYIYNYGIALQFSGRKPEGDRYLKTLPMQIPLTDQMLHVTQEARA